MITKLTKLGLTSTLMYALGLLSVGGSIAIWNDKKAKDEAHAERFGIFVGLWAPTFFAIGNAIAEAARSMK